MTLRAKITILIILEVIYLFGAFLVSVEFGDARLTYFYIANLIGLYFAVKYLRTYSENSLIINLKAENSQLRLEIKEKVEFITQIRIESQQNFRNHMELKSEYEKLLPKELKQ